MTRRLMCGLMLVVGMVLVGNTEMRGDDAVELQATWGDTDDRIWIGPEFWANPLQDWRIRDGRLECIKSAPNRNVQLLTYQATPESSFVMAADVGKMSEATNGWAGFRFAIRGNMNDYRHNAIYGKGIDAGITSDGVLFIGDERKPTGWDWTEDALVSLQLGALHLEDGRVQMRLSAQITDTVGSVRLEHGGAYIHTELRSDDIAGNLALVANGAKPNKNQPQQGSFFFKQWSITGEQLIGSPEQNWGPIFWTQYTLTRDVMKLSAQFPPIGEDYEKIARLEVKQDGQWKEIAEAEIDPLARVALFRIEDWDATRDTPYRVVYNFEGEDCYQEGVIRHDPIEKDEITVAGFTGNKDYGFPNNEIVANVAELEPDLLFFSGDQIYETVGGDGVIRSPVDVATLNYLHKWYLFGWSFKDLLKDRPSVTLPDDHDVYQGNVWGQGGRKVSKQEQGGYVMPAEWVNMVQRTQTAHMPDAYDPTPIEQDITVYYSDMPYGGVGFAILEDRKFKSGPMAYTQGQDTSDAVLLGERQLDFLRAWAKDWRDVEMKATLSQTVFGQAHTHGGNETRPIKSDRDANGWPPEGRNRALREIRKAFAFMYAGDNHLPTVVHHGIDEWEDAGVSFTVPSIAAGFPRAWWPQRSGKVRNAGGPAYAKELLAPDKSPYLGRYVSNWGHPLTFLAAANPEIFVGHQGTKAGDIQLLDDKASGFGFVRFDKKNRNVIIECYRILADLDDPENAQFKDWPVVVPQQANYGRKGAALLPLLNVYGIEDPVVQVIDESNGELVYALRIKGTSFRPKVFREGTYTVRIGEQPDRMKELEGLKSTDGHDESGINVMFD